MSTNRIQKLLISEYCDFDDVVLVESPFAETSREGRGVRQVHLGLTPTKLVLATDCLPNADESLILCIPGLDPDIETLELVAVYPIQCVNLSVFHRRKRQSLKAKFCNNKVLYFELGGFEKRNMFWNLWCERVRFLSPDGSILSQSETSVATSTSNSTLYLVSSKMINNNGTSQIWCQYASGDFDRGPEPPRWPDKHLYMGKHLDDAPLFYTPLNGPITKDQFMIPKCDAVKDIKLEESQNKFQSKVSINNKQLIGINRFKSGVYENCNTSLFLPIETEPDLSSKSSFLNPSISNKVDNIGCLTTFVNVEPAKLTEMANSAVRLWEMQSGMSVMSLRGRHRRRYAFTPQPHFYRGLGPWNVNPGERFTLQMKRAVSAVCIRRQPIEPELRLSVSRRQLMAAISCGNLNEDEKHNNYNTIRNPHKTPIIFFWTPEYWYRPQSAREVYHDLQTHLNKIKQFHQFQSSFRKKSKPKNKSNRGNSSCVNSDIESVTETYFGKVIKSPKHSIMKRLKPRKKSIIASEPLPKETSIQFLKRILKMDMALSAWDFDSQILALQLTLIDRDLFLKIIPEELSILLWQQSSRNAPNISAMIAFSHRLSSLVATEILKDDSEKIRARLIARFINVAEKCNNINNFQSCRSIICGLQTPAIYRLYSTWNYVRKRHSTRYELFEELCRLYRDPRLPAYQSHFASALHSNTYLPFIGDILGKLLDVIPAPSNNSPETSSASSGSLGIAISIKPRNDETEKNGSSDKCDSRSILRKLLTSIKVWNSECKLNDSQTSSYQSFRAKTKKRPDDYNTSVDKFNQLFYYEDNRQERLQECIVKLKIYQEASAKYRYDVNELAREYLLKSRYREDRDNFMHSFSMEPALILE